MDALYPAICPICDDIIMPRGADICPACEKKLTYVPASFCMRCGKPVDDDMEYCSDCKRGEHVYDEGRAALVYDEYISKSIYRFKYYGKREFAKFYARVIYDRLGRKLSDWNADVIIPVPIHKSRLKKRGYNQAALIAKELSRKLNIPVREDLVCRNRTTTVQKRLSAVERQNNLKKAFNVTQNVVKYDSVLIVDDIYTTGATVDAMARCLKTAGVRKVFFVTLSIGRGA